MKERSEQSDMTVYSRGTGKDRFSARYDNYRDDRKEEQERTE